MFTSKLLAVATLLCTALAQTPAGFAPTTNKKLGLTAGGIEVSPGLLIPRAQTASPPTISAPSNSNASTYALFMIDIDLPINNTRVTLLHWFQPDLVVDSAGTLVPSNTNASGPGAAYLQPNPPAGDIAHRYTFVLYEQPSTFSVPAAFAAINPPANVPARGGFSVAAFAAAADLGEPISGNFWTVQNTTVTATGAATATGSASPTTTPTGIPFLGTAAGLKQARGVLGGVAGLAAGILLL
ncbi:hypothetical protein PVAG01_10993 [Phlyctema vagabunda]|uniref:PEBP-like protein n=1 Tax=Phlyctema vagabunda TaxID=108571 RepID=A0ABR4P3W0_9HELO